MKLSDKPINHPGRYYPLQYFYYHCIAATPPSKGGESNINLLKFNIKNRLPLLILPVKNYFRLLKLATMGTGDEAI
jgi:hypothetical protein